MNNSAREDDGCAALALDNQRHAHDAQGGSAQSTATEVATLANKCTEDKLRAVANHLDRIATEYVNSLRSTSERARRR